MPGREDEKISLLDIFLVFKSITFQALISELDLPVSRSEGVHFLVVTHCESCIVSKTNCIWNSNCKSKKNYMLTIARRMLVDKFNRPLHSDITVNQRGL